MHMQTTPASMVMAALTEFEKSLPEGAPSGDLYFTGNAPRSRYNRACAQVTLAESGDRDVVRLVEAAQIFEDFAADAPARYAVSLRALAGYLTHQAITVYRDQVKERCDSYGRPEAIRHVTNAALVTSMRRGEDPDTVAERLCRRDQEHDYQVARLHARAARSRTSRCTRPAARTIRDAFDTPIRAGNIVVIAGEDEDAGLVKGIVVVINDGTVDIRVTAVSTKTSRYRLGSMIRAVNPRRITVVS